jgi:hypothetical protein
MSVAEKRPQRYRNSLISSPKKTIHFVNTTPNRISIYQVLAQLWSCHVSRDMDNSESAEGQEPLHIAGGPTDYLCSATVRLRLKCDGTRAENRFRLSAKRRSPFKSAGTSVQSTSGSRGVRISGSNAGYTMFRGSVKSTDYPLHSPVSPSLPLPCVTVCHHISTGLYYV